MSNPPSTYSQSARPIYLRSVSCCYSTLWPKEGTIPLKTTLLSRFQLFLSLSICPLMREEASSLCSVAVAIRDETAELMFVGHHRASTGKHLGNTVVWLASVLRAPNIDPPFNVNEKCEAPPKIMKLSRRKLTTLRWLRSGHLKLRSLLDVKPQKLPGGGSRPGLPRSSHPPNL